MIRASILGATGYGGVELVRLLLDHPEVEIVSVSGHSTVGKRYHEVYPQFAGLLELEVVPVDAAHVAASSELVFSCLEHGVGTEVVGQIVAQGTKVVDFSADFRLKSASVYAQHYKTHPLPELIDEAVYGLPELHRDEIREARLVAVPGCYPTSAILALAPLAARQVVALSSLIVDSKSGTSGAGRAKTDHPFRFCERAESMAAYGIGRHRHQPEMEQELAELSGLRTKVLFSPHLIPVVRGILTTAYAKLKDRSLDAAGLHDLYDSFYQDEPFVRVCPPGAYPATKHVSGTNFCDVAVTHHPESGRAIAVAVVDNLGKGLSSAAVQCMNLMFGLPETLGLMRAGMWP